MIAFIIKLGYSSVVPDLWGPLPHDFAMFILFSHDVTKGSYVFEVLP